MRRLIASAAAVVTVALFASTPNAGASVQPTPEPETLQCARLGASCNQGSDCCSKYCCSRNNRNMCVTAAQRQNLSCINS